MPAESIGFCIIDILQKNLLCFFNIAEYDYKELNESKIHLVITNVINIAFGKYLIFIRFFSVDQKEN